MSATHWHATTSVPGPVDPDGCCADQPTAASLAAGLRATGDADAKAREQRLLGGAEK